MPVQYQDFVRSEDSRMEDWQRRFEMADIFGRARPNAAHRALAGLVQRGRMDLLITQNVDGLHQASGVPPDRLVELHGNSTYATCLDCGAHAELAMLRPVYDSGASPRCSVCGGLLKAAVVSFGQAMPEAEMRRAMEAAENCGLFLVLGSSLAVHPAAGLPALAVRAGEELVIINREPTPLDSLASVLIRMPLAESFENSPL